MVGIFMGCLVYCYGEKRPCLEMRDASTCGDVSCYRACATLVTGHQGPHASLGLVMSLHGHKLTIKLIYCVQGNLLKLNVMIIKSQQISYV